MGYPSAILQKALDVAHDPVARGVGHGRQVLAALDLFEVGEHGFDGGMQLLIAMQGCVKALEKAEVVAALVDLLQGIFAQHIVQYGGGDVADERQGRVILHAVDAGHEHLPQLAAGASADDLFSRRTEREVEDEGDVGGIGLSGSLVPCLRLFFVVHF